MEWVIRESGHGGYVAEYGARHAGGVHVGQRGSTMPAFIVYYSSHFDTEKQAKDWIRKNPNPLRR